VIRCGFLIPAAVKGGSGVPDMIQFHGAVPELSDRRGSPSKMLRIFSNSCPADSRTPAPPLQGDSPNNGRARDLAPIVTPSADAPSESTLIRRTRILSRSAHREDHEIEKTHKAQVIPCAIALPLLWDFLMLQPLSDCTGVREPLHHAFFCSCPGFMCGQSHRELHGFPA